MRVLNQDTLYSCSCDCLWLDPLLSHLVLGDIARSLDTDLAVVVDVMAEIERIILLVDVGPILYIMCHISRVAHAHSDHASVRVAMREVGIFEEADSLRR